MSECPSRWVVAFIFSLIHSPGVEKCWVDRIHTGGGRTRSLRTPGRSWHQTCKQCLTMFGMELAIFNSYTFSIAVFIAIIRPFFWWKVLYSIVNLPSFPITSTWRQFIYSSLFQTSSDTVFMSAPDRSWHQQLSRSLSTDPSRGWRGQWAGDGAAKQDRLHYTFTFPAKFTFLLCI